MSNPPKILLLHLMSNGDCLYATAIARQIKQDYPNCHLTWCIASWCRATIDNNPFVDAVWEIPGVTRANCTNIIRSLKKDIAVKKANGEFDEVFFTQIADENLANYDGTVRSAILRGYGRPITVPLTPVLRLRNDEKERAAAFAEKYRLKSFKNVILFEFAPQSGQLAMTPELAMNIARDIVAHPDTAIILSSSIKIGDVDPRIMDGSQLTLRETAAISHYCTFLLGCSSGITWITTSDAAKQLPMVQLLDPNAFWVNPISRDFERCGFATDQLIEIYDFDMKKAAICIKEAMDMGIPAVKAKYYQPLPLQFRTTSRSIYNMLVFLQFGAILKHIRININTWGWQPALIGEIFKGIITAPFKLVYNVISKRLKK